MVTRTGAFILTMEYIWFLIKLGECTQRAESTTAHEMGGHGVDFTGRFALTHPLWLTDHIWFSFVIPQHHERNKGKPPKYGY